MKNTEKTKESLKLFTAPRVISGTHTLNKNERKQESFK